MYEIMHIINNEYIIYIYMNVLFVIRKMLHIYLCYGCL